MTLMEVVMQLNYLPDETFICARRPWVVDMDCELVPIGPDYRIPTETVARGYEHFLDIATAKEVCEAFENYVPSLGEIAALLVFYAENDAYPEWIYERQRP